MPRTITAAQFASAADRSRLSATALAELLHISRDTFYKYKANGVNSAPSVGRVLDKMGLWLRDEDGASLPGYTDRDLLDELGRRLGEAKSTRPDSDMASSGHPGPDPTNEQTAGGRGGSTKPTRGAVTKAGRPRVKNRDSKGDSADDAGREENAI